MNSTDIIILVSGFAIYLVFRVVSFISRQLAIREAEELLAESKVELRPIQNIKIEKHGDVYYWFDEESDHFIAQGKTIEDFILALRAVHKNKVFMYGNLLLAGPDFELTIVDPKLPPEQLLPQ
jgi:hypothetical protein